VEGGSGIAEIIGLPDEYLARKFGSAYCLQAMDDRERRVEMVERQIAARGVRDPRVLDAMREVPRQLFVPEDLRSRAYEDRALPIADGQTISQPYIVAIMTELLAPEPQHRVLEIGTGSGYQTAILSRLSGRVFSVERHQGLADAAQRLLATLGMTNVDVHVGDGTEGLTSEAPFDRILVTAGAPSIPDALRGQLGEGGRLVIPVGPSGFQHLTIVDRTGTGYAEQQHDACVFVPLIGRHGWKP
jgi:protein-L-isoaspartate(D-aspartate) O-methyltransferase